MVHRKSSEEVKGRKKSSKKLRHREEFPVIQAELDEDVDDDLAFNSDDERLYGQFFSKSNQGGIGLEFERLNAADGVGEEIALSDDSRDEIDISEMLESKEERTAKRNKRRVRRGPASLAKEDETVLGSTSEPRRVDMKKLLL